MVAVQQLFTVDDVTEKILLNETGALKQLSKKDIQNDKIVVVSVAGEFRIGKSFLLSICQKYLHFMYADKSKKNTFAETWMGDELEPLEGFRWELGIDGVTSGAQMSKIFRTTLANGEKVVIILLDTQGMSDHKTTTSVNTKIFGLSTMVSSVQIFFVKDHISENHLKELKFFTDYGSLVQEYNENTTISPYQQLLFYVRDWANAHQYPYGYSGGKKYIENILQVREDNKEELRSIRKWIGKCFIKRECFLMPHPGRKITDVSFDGKFCDLENEYKSGLNEFLPHLFAKENLRHMLKIINGKPVTVSQFVWYLREYTNTMNSQTLPTPQDFIFMNIQLSQQLCKEEVRQKYEKRMEQIFARTQTTDSPPENIEMIIQNADEDFKKFPKFGDQNTTDTNWMKLKNEIERHWNRLCKNKEKIDGIQEEVREKEETVKKLTNDLSREIESSRKKVVLGAAVGAGACVVGIGASMIAAPALLVQAGLLATESASIGIGAVAAGSGVTACIGAGAALCKEEPTKIEETF